MAESEKNDADLAAAALGHVVTVGEGERYRLAQDDLGDRGVLVPLQPDAIKGSAAALVVCSVTGSTVSRDRAGFRRGMSVRTWLSSTMVFSLSPDRLPCRD